MNVCPSYMDSRQTTNHRRIPCLNDKYLMRMYLDESLAFHVMENFATPSVLLY